MNLQEFQRLASETDNIDASKPRSESIPYFGAMGELGSFLSEIKKSIRDGSLYTGYKDNLSEELGDLLWYIARLASAHGVSLPRIDIGDTGTPTPPSDDEHLFTLAHEVSELVAKLRQRAIDPTVAFNPTLNSVKKVCEAEELELPVVLAKNIGKNRDTWQADPTAPAPQYDQTFPEYERLPRRLTVEFVQIARGDNTEVIQRVQGIAVGDRLTDNAYDPDGYRYHDAFHLAYVATLGWSPVVRRMLRVKRKSDRRTDEVEDGARAAIIEEAIASLVFNYAREHSWLGDLGRIDHGILKHIHQMVRGLEVANCRAWEWQHAILRGFSVFRQLRAHKGGWITFDASKRSIVYSTTPPRTGSASS